MTGAHPTFAEWLAAERPDVRLTALQQLFAEDLADGKREHQWTGTRASGRTFVLELVADYFKALTR